jgi:hypothetical protein
MPPPAPPPAPNQTYHIDTSRVVLVVSEKFISFAIDQCLFRSKRPAQSAGGPCNVNFSDPDVLALARSFAPAYVRVGGTAADNITYDVPVVQAAAGITSGKNIPAGILTTATWDELNEFVKAAGWELIFGLNTLVGWTNSPGHTWEPSNARSLMQYTQRNGYPLVGYELGNEPDAKKGGPVRNKSVSPAITDAHFSTLFEVATSVYGSIGNGTRQSPWIIGPDVTHHGVKTGFLQEFLTNLSDPGVDIVTWHHYFNGARTTVRPADYVDPTFLNGYTHWATVAKAAYDGYRHTNKQLWMGETGGAGNGAAGHEALSGTFLGVFWWLDKLGAAAATGHSVVARQQFQYLVVPVDGGGARVTPEFWATQLWRKTMGAHVLAVGGDRTGVLRVYAHAHDAAVRTVGVLAINLGDVPATAAIDLPNLGTAIAEHDEYRLTSYPSPGDVAATEVALNGRELRLLPLGVLPELHPITVPGAEVTVAPRSVTFAVFHR